MKSSAFKTSIDLIRIQFLSNKIQKKLTHNANNFLALSPLFQKLEKQFNHLKNNDYFVMLSHSEYITKIDQLLDSYTKSQNNSVFLDNKKVSIVI
jgi:hypothetical protein